MSIILTVLGIILAVLVALTVAVNYKAIINFSKGSWRELNRVTFPTREKAIAQAYIVLGSVAIFAVMFGLFDLLLVRTMGLLF
ncbi:preprotein translocase subunit SecE [Entomospira culicis]|uniref:Preprotein translocase subunit SecE n=1 Tax=Entomospira culicis TaxID=2719989 RepID=A0A968KW96_9SPIO|nr:preprotein translocase subunit SecE [Entomospira culicis]NIZ19799.1 preprotein translocase subunit SecE [Entomospira culicis]NIZ70013.1 preprotein translocase subunit SecE [Entomospira culicis]WDI37118.1 preprotein translocase subunit SecE [Entomospira culicis]WDI38747.1 preprotein translocase subunit SecE [Entomospira culicis]